MQFSLDNRTCALSVGEFAGFTLGPRDSGVGGSAGVWRAQLGQQWHSRLRAQAEAATVGHEGASAAFEVPLTLGYRHRGWSLTFTGRLDQLVTTTGARIIREIKTVAGPLPADESVLRADHPDYFVQVLTYLALLRTGAPQIGSQEAEIGGQPPGRAVLDLGPSTGGTLRAELVFVEVGSGITQVVVLTADDEVLFRAQLERLVEFLELRLQSRERLRHLSFRPAFAVLRPGQEDIQAELLAAIGETGKRIPDTGKPAETQLAHPLSGVRYPVSPILFEAPTGYGKTGVLLEFALGRLRDGRFSRLLYLTGKSTGQLQVVQTLTAMTASDIHPELKTQNPEPGAMPVAAWQVRPKSEHCVNPVFHCVRDACSYLADLENRWTQNGLARFYLFEHQARDLETLRAAGREARLCPYEITRAALPFNDVWIGDYNYVFAPDSRAVFFERPGFNPAETLLIVDEAHNLPARVADAWSHVIRADDAEALLAELHPARPPATLVLAWEHWSRLLRSLKHAESLDAPTEEEIRDAVDRLATLVATTALDYAALGPRVSQQLWQTLALRDWLVGDFAPPTIADSALAGFRSPASEMARLLWCPRAGELHFTCLDAAPLIGQTLRAFAGVILASATLQPAEVFAGACGLDAVGEPPGRSLPVGDRTPMAGQLVPPLPPAERLGSLNKRQTRKLYRELTSGAELLKIEEAREAARPRLLLARTPWRDDAYTVGVDTRVDTTFQHRARHYATTAATVEALHAAAGSAPSPLLPSDPSPPPASVTAQTVAVFFPSYAYAGSVIKALESSGSPLRAAVQPRSVDLAAQTAWVNESLVRADALFLVLGSSFAESIDLLGGRVTHALVVGPALPEVNAIQRRRLAELEHAGLSRDAAFRRVYQIPGMQKVNQAVGRLVRAPGQRAKVLLHCRRFAEPSYSSLLAPDYQHGEVIATDDDLAAWLRASSPSA